MATDTQTLFSHDTHGVDGDEFTRYHVLNVPADWSEDDVRAWADEEFPARRCQHAHDCCGHFYPRKASVTLVTDGSFADTYEVLVRQRWVANI